MSIRTLNSIPGDGYVIDVVEVTEGGDRVVMFDVFCRVEGCWWESFGLPSEADARAEWDEHECTDLSEDDPT